MKILRWLHCYIGIVIALFMFLLAVSGGALIFKEELWRLSYPAMKNSQVMPAGTDESAALKSIGARFPGEIKMVRFPREGMAAYHVYLLDGEALVNPDDFEVIRKWRWYQSLTGVFSELHVHLAAGAAGKTVVGFLGLIGGLMAISGVLLWWPVRRQYRINSLLPNSWSRLRMLRLHRDLGVLSGILILLFSLTGAGLVFGEQSRALLNALFSSNVQTRQKSVVQAEGRIAPPSLSMIQLVRQQFPDAALMSWSPPKSGSALHLFRLRQSDEIHPFGRTMVFVNANTGQVLDRSDALQEPLGERIRQWFFPLHSGRVGGWAYRAITVVAAIAMALLSISGTISFLRRLGKKTLMDRPRSKP